MASKYGIVFTRSKLLHAVAYVARIAVIYDSLRGNKYGAACTKGNSK
ncbi:MAG: hypothetical protein J5613_04975 [Alphaproteobacteria bacterium]|nr:hypothetical protein [Alphaproteobacteria bacterium]MBR4806347.1 hypothetical protein [Alphaproteobacteria bacterium]